MSEIMHFLGIDPGGSGGLAVIDSLGTLVEVTKMPETTKDVSDFIKKHGPQIRMALLERVHSFPGQGVVSSFTFGASYGALWMALVAHDVRFGQITSTVWQKALGCQLRGRSGPTDRKTEKKNYTKARAQELFPAVKITHAIADALLIAEYARRQNVSTFNNL